MRPSPTTRRRVGKLVASTLGIVIAASLLPAAAPVSAAQTLPAAPSLPNIVYVVVDDFSANLLPSMAEVGALTASGVAFENFFVTDSQCCPSRASTMTGLYPHNSGVRTNTWRLGGFEQFTRRHGGDTLGPQMDGAGYRTGYVGKYLNGYRPEGSGQPRDGRLRYPEGFVPPGWDEWFVGGDGYSQFDYTLAEAVDADVAEVVHYGRAEEDYGTDVLAGHASAFIERVAALSAAGEPQPFFLTVAPFAVHGRLGNDKDSGERDFPAAPRHRAVDDLRTWPADWALPAPATRGAGDCGAIAGGCEAVVFPDPVDAAAYNEVPRHAPSWMRRAEIGPKKLAELRENHLDRVRMAQSVDELVATVRTALVDAGVADSTYIVFTSDNGFHLGEHGLRNGKNSMFDHDIRVPFIVVPPGGVPARTVSSFAQNTDLLPTFLDIAGARAEGLDGTSLLPLVRGEPEPRGWRRAALVEFTRDQSRRDPDAQTGQVAPTYRGLRTEDYVYVDYARRRDAPGRKQGELYDLRTDPAATVNVYGRLSDEDRRALDRALDRYATCEGRECVQAARDLPDIKPAAGP